MCHNNIFVRVNINFNLDLLFMSLYYFLLELPLVWANFIHPPFDFIILYPFYASVIQKRLGTSVLQR